MANGPITSTTAANDFDEAWSTELHDAVKLDVVIADLFEDWSSKLPHGDTLHLVDSHNMTANAKAAGTDATPEVITEGEQTFQPSTHQIVARTLENFVEVQSKYDLRKDFTDKASYALARAMDVACAALLDDNTTQTVGILGAELSFSNWLQARKYLRDSAIRGKLVAVIPPGTYNGLMKQEQFTNALYNGDTEGMAIREAQVGTILKTTLYESQLLIGTAPNAYGHTWAMGHFVKIIQKQPKVDTWYSPLAKSWIAAYDQIYGVFEVQEADEAAAVTTRARLGGVRLECYK